MKNNDFLKFVYEEIKSNPNITQTGLTLRMGKFKDIGVIEEYNYVNLGYVVEDLFEIYDCLEGSPHSGFKVNGNSFDPLVIPEGYNGGYIHIEEVIKKCGVDNWSSFKEKEKIEFAMHYIQDKFEL